MKRLLFSLIAIGLLSTSMNAQSLKKGSIIESKDEISCASFSHMEFAADGISQYSGGFLSGYLSRANCKNITEGMDLKIVKSKAFKKSYGNMTKGILVKLPTGMTTWVAR